MKETMAHAYNSARSLLKACAQGNSDKVAKLIEQGVDVAFEDCRPLRVAFAHGHCNIVLALLDAGADKSLALRLAARHGQESIVTALLATSESERYDKVAALKQAAFFGHLPIVMALLAAGASPRSGSVLSDDVICHAIRGRNNAIVDHLLSVGAEFTAEALQEAAGRGNLRLVQLMIDSPKFTFLQKRSAAYAAARAGYASVLQLILDRGLLSQGYAKELVLRAAEMGHAHVVRLLLPLARPTQIDLKHHIVRACMTGHLPIVRNLWEAYNKNDTAQRPDEFIETAADHVQYDIVEFFLLRGFAPPAGMWRHLAFYTRSHHRLVHAVQPQHFHALPEHIKSLWLQVHLRVRVRLQARLRAARANLDRPPTVPCGKARPTREELIANLRTGGRRFAREYWAEGAALFVKGEELGEVPEEFKEVKL